MHLMRSRWLILIFSAMVMLGTLTACGSKNDSPPPRADTPTAQATAAPENTATPAALPPTAVPPTATPTAEATEEVTSTATLPDVPLPDDAQGVSYEFEELLFSSPSDVATLLAFYRTALSNDDWVEETDSALVSDTLVFTNFDRDGETIGVTIIASDEASQATIDLRSAPSLSGSETDSQEMAGGSGYTIADWPTPDDATNIDVSGDTLTFHSALPLAEVAEFYRPTFEMMELGTTCLDDAADYTSISCSYGNGDITVNFFAFEGFDDTEVEIEFTNYALGSPEDTSSAGTGELGVTDEDGLPLPDDYLGYSSESGEYRRTISTTSPSDVDTLVTFFETELGTRGWTLDDSTQTGTDVTLTFSGADGELVVTLQSGDTTDIVLTVKNRDAAEADGILPPAGQARLYLINFSEDELTVTIDDQTIDLAPGAGMESIDDAISLDLAPGTYDVTITVGGQSTTDTITVGPDETWDVLLDVQGPLALQMF